MWGSQEWRNTCYLNKAFWLGVVVAINIVFVALRVAMAALPRAPLLALCNLPVGVRLCIASFLAPRLRRRCVHSLARAIKDLFFHVELPLRLVVFRRWERQLWMVAGAKPSARPSPVWPRPRTARKGL